MLRSSIRSTFKRLIYVGALLACWHPAANAEPVRAYILALSWQPAFCQYSMFRPECRSQTAADYSATQLTLHGLWVESFPVEDAQYCAADPVQLAIDRSYKWCELDAPAMSLDTRARLERVMPGTQSCLERHEWLKHGGCTGLDFDSYMSISASLTESAGRTKLNETIAAHVGGTVLAQELAQAFEQDFGPDARKALFLRCKKDGGRSYLSEVWILLSAALIREGGDQPALSADLLYKEAKIRGGRCPARIYIDPVGP